MGSLAGASMLGAERTVVAAGESEAKTAPDADLMQEHGVLKRVLLAYGEIVRRIGAGKEFPAQAVDDSATIIRTFVENYHERQEEKFLFPRFRQAVHLVDLVDVLYAQHQAGRRLTERILAESKSLAGADSRSRLASDLEAFIRMYEPIS